MKIGLRTKFGLFFFLFSIITFMAIWWMYLQFTAEAFLERYLGSIAQSVEVTAYSLELTPKELRRYGEEGIVDTRYEQVLKQMNDIREISGLKYLYIVYPTGEDTAVWLFDATEEEGGEELGAPVESYSSELFEQLRTVLKSGEESHNLDTTESNLGMLVSIYYPLKDENGETIAVLGGDMGLYNIIEGSMTIVLRNSRYLVGMVVISVLVLLVFVQFCVVRPIRKLKQGVQKMAKGELGIQISSRRRDEIGDITRVFNQMSLNIQGHISEVEKLNQAYQKFVPPETFEILQKSSIVDVRLGDQARTGLSILSMEPVEFEKVSRNMNSEDMFQYINGILEQTVPAVLSEGGTIERFEKAGLCSFYKKSSEHALKSALASCESLRKNNISLSAGIAQGPVMVGIAGHKERMDMISISEQTMISEILKNKAKKYYASVLISSSAAAQIPDMEQYYHCRFLGYLKITVTGRLEGMIDVFDGDDPAERKFKQMTKEMFEQGVRKFAEKNYIQARQAFIEVLKQNRNDNAAREYLYRCNRYMQMPEDKTEVYLEIL